MRNACIMLRIKAEYTCILSVENVLPSRQIHIHFFSLTQHSKIFIVLIYHAGV